LQPLRYFLFIKNQKDSLSMDDMRRQPACAAFLLYFGKKSFVLVEIDAVVRSDPREAIMNSGFPKAVH
jgi:hypothetical protein